MTDLSNVPWRPANPRRGVYYDNAGITYTEHAKAWIVKFPIDTTVSREVFDDWAEGRNLLVVPPMGTSKQSDAWKAHVQRRNEQRALINIAASHPRMFETEGSVSFQIRYVKGEGIYKVRAANSEETLQELLDKIKSITSTQQKHLTHLFQGTDWSRLPAYTLEHAIIFFEGLEEMKEDFSRQLIRHAAKTKRFLIACRRQAEQAAANNQQITHTPSGDDDDDDDGEDA